MLTLHDRLRTLVKRLPSDYEPYGKAVRDCDDGKLRLDCSCGCKYFLPLEGDLGMDWGVCSSTTSPRAGLLTFEHMNGETCFEGDDDADQ